MRRRGTMSRTLAIALAASAALAAPAAAQVRPERTFPADSASRSTKTEAPALVLGGTFVITANGFFYKAVQSDVSAEGAAPSIHYAASAEL